MIVSLNFGGDGFPYKALEMGNAKYPIRRAICKTFIMAYSTLFSGTGKLQKDEGIDITRMDYSNGYTLYAFDLTPDLAEGGHFNLLRQGNVRLELKFGAALVETVNVIVYAEFENIIEIDKQRNIIFDCKN